MPQPLGYNEAMGSMEAHLAVMKNRVDNAKAEYDSAVKKGMPALIDSTKKIWEQRTQEYEELMSQGQHRSEGPQEKPETIN